MQCTMTTSPPAASPAMSQTQPTSWAQTTDVTKLETISSGEGLPSYFDRRIPSPGNSSAMDIDISSLPPSASCHPVSHFSQPTGHDMHSSTATSTFAFSLSGHKRASLINHQSNSSTASYFGHATPVSASDASSPRTLQPVVLDPNTSEAVMVTPTNSLPGSNGAVGVANTRAFNFGNATKATAPTSNPVEPSPFFTNVSLDLPSVSSAANNGPFSPRTTVEPPKFNLSFPGKARPNMKISMPPAPKFPNVGAGGIASPMNLANTVNSPRPNLKLSLGLAGTPGAVPRGTPVSAVATTKLFATTNFIEASELHQKLGKDTLVLDVRCSESFSQSHIRNAINMCVPTMLLKRDKFTLHKLLANFQNSSNAERLERWSEYSVIVAYGTCSADKGEVSLCQSVLGKFVKEGFTGRVSVLSGGFDQFLEKYTDDVEMPDSETQDTTNPAVSSSALGGLAIPNGPEVGELLYNAIRQNTNLQNGPSKADLFWLKKNEHVADRLPRWLAGAYQPADNGMYVGKRFFDIEVAERDRLKAAARPVVAGQPRLDVPRLCGVEHGEKNRYKGVYPFEHNRVKLMSYDKANSTDYINASHIKPLRSNKRYIASQGPKPETFGDFWSMVWDHDARVIVNLTADVENGMVKCNKYWMSGQYRDIQVKNVFSYTCSLSLDGAVNCPTDKPVTEGCKDLVLVRHFAVSNLHKPYEPLREIVQVHYYGWPDLGGFDQPGQIIALVELANSINRNLNRPELYQSGKPIARSDQIEHEVSSRPMVIHCSAGCGRTGTFCTIDTVLDMLKRQQVERDEFMAQVSAAAECAIDEEDEDDETKLNNGAEGTGPFGFGAPPTPRSPASPVSPRGPPHRSLASVFRGPGAHELHNSRPHSYSTSRRGSTVAPSPAFAPLDLKWMGNDNVDLVRVTVEDLRTQRTHMVQTSVQYALCYDAVADWLMRVKDNEDPGAVVEARLLVSKEVAREECKSMVGLGE